MFQCVVYREFGEFIQTECCDDHAEAVDGDHAQFTRMNHFHENLKYLMRRSGDTQTSLADVVEVTQAAVSNWLQDTMPREVQLNAVARHFSVTTDELINHELPHKENIQALTELARELKELKSQWDGVAKRMKEAATRNATQREYSSAVQNDWMANGIEGCSSDLAKVLQVYFPEKTQNTEANNQPKGDSAANENLTSS